jgi:hypothetical protein
LRVTFFRVAAMTQAIAPTSMKKIFQKSYWEDSFSSEAN